MPRSPSLATQKVLKVFLDRPTDEQYGLEIATSAGLKSGSLYPILARLEREGWLTSGWEDIDESAEGRRRRRYYTMTSLGAREAKSVLHETAATLGFVPGFRTAPT